MKGKIVAGCGIEKAYVGPSLNFIDHEKAFDSVDRDTLWQIMRHYGIPRLTSSSS